VSPALNKVNTQQTYGRFVFVLPGRAFVFVFVLGLFVLLLTTTAPGAALLVPMLVTFAFWLMLLSTRFAVVLIAVLVIVFVLRFALAFVALFEAVSPQAANMLAASASPATVIDLFLIKISCLLKI
jgi:hypothetical protein